MLDLGFRVWGLVECLGFGLRIRYHISGLSGYVQRLRKNERTWRIGPGLSKASWSPG